MTTYSPYEYYLTIEFHTSKSSPFPKHQILDAFKLTELADDKFKSNENGRKFSKLENRNCSLRAISLFQTVSSKDLYCRHVKTRACLGDGKKNYRKINKSDSKMELALGKVENIVGVRRKCWKPAFSPFATMLSYGFFLRVIHYVWMK